MTKLTIFGESHFEPSSVKGIEDQIRKMKPKIIVHELLDRFVLTPDEVKKALAECGKPDTPCDPETNIDIFRLAVELGAGLVGCDLSDKEKRDLKSQALFKQFAAREIRMLEVIQQYAHRDDVVVVVGDIHLRSTWNRSMGPSPIHTSWIKDRLDANIVRAAKEFQEVQ